MSETYASGILPSEQIQTDAGVEFRNYIHVFLDRNHNFLDQEYKNDFSTFGESCSLKYV